MHDCGGSWPHYELTPQRKLPLFIPLPLRCFAIRTGYGAGYSMCCTPGSPVSCCPGWRSSSANAMGGGSLPVSH